MARMARLAVGLLLGLALAAAGQQQQGPQQAAPPAAERAPTEISSSVVLAVPSDWPKCRGMVERAAGLNVKRLQFVPTLFWVDQGPLAPPPGFDPSCKGPVFLEAYYCYNRFNATRVAHFCYDRDACGGPPSPADVRAFQAALRDCMALAADKGFDISVNLHVDDATRGGLGGWRNTLDFRPREKYGGYSYEDVILGPIADAVAAARRPSTQVCFTMQGEMGATVFFHPREWAQVAADLRTRLGGTPQTTHVGVGLNNAKLCGCLLVPSVDQREFLRRFPAAFEAARAEFDLPAIQALFHDAVDYVALSAYVPQADVRFQPCELEGLMSRLDEEFGRYGVTLKDLLARGKEIHWVETGVGGGTSPQGDQKASTAEEAAYTPFFGMSGPYTRASDPFLLWDLARPSPVRDYSRWFYRQLAAYLAGGGCQYTVAHAYVWNLPSWDVQGLYPTSTTGEGSYRDPEVVATIDAHNAAVAGGRQLRGASTG